MVSLKDVAKVAGVSVETVTRVLKGKYKGRTENSRKVMQHVKEVAQKLNYRPNIAARTIRTKKSMLVGIIVEKESLLTHPVFTETLKGINEALEEKGYILTITSLEGISNSTLELKIFKEHVLDGIFIIGDIQQEQIDAMRKQIPVSVLINMNQYQDTFCVRRDEYSAGITAGKELISLGYDKALYFDIPFTTEKVHHYSIKDRLSGFKEGFSNGEVKVLALQTAEIYNYLKSNQEKIDKKTVLVASHNLRLFRILSAISRLSIKVGEDFGLATIDDETGLICSFPEVSRVSFPRISLGHEAGKIMLAALKKRESGCRSVIYKGEWICGLTTPQVK